MQRKFSSLITVSAFNAKCFFVDVNKKIDFFSFFMILIDTFACDNLNDKAKVIL